MPQESRDREVQIALQQIRSFHKRTKRGWVLGTSLWRLCLEVGVVFFVAFLVGLGLGVMVGILFPDWLWVGS